MFLEKIAGAGCELVDRSKTAHSLFKAMDQMAHDGTPTTVNGSFVTHAEAGAVLYQPQQIRWPLRSRIVYYPTLKARLCAFHEGNDEYQSLRMVSVRLSDCSNYMSASFPTFSSVSFRTQLKLATFRNL